MRRRIALVLLVLGMSLAPLATARAGEEPVTSSPEPAADAEHPAAAPKIVFDEIEHDFGTLGQNETVKHTFNFKNEGNALLVIDNIKTTCGCTGTLLSSKEIPPGEVGSIQVTFRSGSSGGTKKKSIYVNSNDPEHPAMQLQIASVVVVPVELRPHSLYWVAEKNAESSRTVDLLYQPSLNLGITGMTSSSPAFSASVRKKDDGDLPGYSIDIKYDGSLRMGQFNETLTVLTDNPDHQELKVIIRGKVVGAIRVVPDAVSLGVIKDDTLPERVVRVYSSTNEPFEITEVESSSPIITTEYGRQGSSNKYQLRIRLTEKPPQGGFSERLLIKTNNPSEDTIEVPVYAHVQ